MKVYLVGYSVLDSNGWWDYLQDHGLSYEQEDEAYVEDADDLAELAGRICYQSFGPHQGTKSNQAYLANILKQGHYSVLEHASATFIFTGVSRSLTHELVRHRHLSFSQLSQRYVDETNMHYIIPPLLVQMSQKYMARWDGVAYDSPEAEAAAKQPSTPEEALAGAAFRCFTAAVEQARESYVALYNALDVALGPDEAKGVERRKMLRQTARAVLPNCTATTIMVTGNLRAWREVIAKRNSPAADPEIRALAAEVLRQLSDLAPNTFQDMVEVPTV